jgi:hypothetical protein
MPTPTSSTSRRCNALGAVGPAHRPASRRGALSSWPRPTPLAPLCVASDRDSRPWTLQPFDNRPTGFSSARCSPLPLPLNVQSSRALGRGRRTSRHVLASSTIVPLCRVKSPTHVAPRRTSDLGPLQGSRSEYQFGMYAILCANTRRPRSRPGTRLKLPRSRRLL